MGTPRQFRALSYFVVLYLVLGTLLFARLQTQSFRDCSGSRAGIGSTESHSKKQSFNYKSQFQSYELTQVFRFFPAPEALTEVQNTELVGTWSAPDTSLYNRPPPHC